MRNHSRPALAKLDIITRSWYPRVRAIVLLSRTLGEQDLPEPQSEATRVQSVYDVVVASLGACDVLMTLALIKSAPGQAVTKSVGCRILNRFHVGYCASYAR